MAKRILKKSTVRTVIALAILFALVYALILTGVLGDYYFATLVSVGISIILAVSLNLITGFTGQFSLGHAGFMAIGAYVCAIITSRIPTQWGFIVGMFAGAAAAAVIGVAVGLPTLRLGGDYLAIATLGMAEIIRIVFQNLKITNGAAGLSNLPRFVNWPYLFIFTVGTVVIIRNFLKSTHGRACIAVREDEIAAESMGVSSTKYKVLAFTIGAFFAGIAGAMYSSYFYFINPGIFGFKKSIDVLVVVVLGGMGSLSGSVIAAVVLAIINMLLQSFAEIRMIIYALLLVLIMIFRPQGLMGDKELSRDLLKKIKLPAFLSKKGGDK
ncbi:MAG: branched-chain amino acid ABC transporter permease [Clostridia bacterium]